MDLEHVSTVINLPGLDPHCCAFLLKELIKYVMYMRQQIPSLFPEVEKEAKEIEDIKKSHKRITLHQKKVLNSFNSFLSLCNDIDTLFSTIGDVKTLFFCIVLGQSVNIPHELFFVRFHMDPSIVVDQSKFPNISNNLIRRLVMNGPEIFFTLSKQRKIFLLAHVDNQHVIEGFVPKQNFKVALPKQVRRMNHEPSKRVLVVEVTTPSTQTNKQDTLEHMFSYMIKNNKQEHKDSNNMWFLSSSHIKGFTAHHGSQKDQLY
ncbi:MAD2L1BP [Acrasis kona]|uniref:MAD2L1BP n=1 Tax=Acrasis kona TaxID=1008807 RepID=A0AAW2YK81_9EUKA